MKLDLPERDFDGYIFDCDGTVVDSMPLHFRAWTAAFEKHGAPFVFTEQKFYGWAGVTETDVVARLNREHGSDLNPEGVVRTKQVWFQEHMHELQPVDEVAAIVREVAGKGKAISVASGSEMVIVKPELEIVGLSEFFEIIVTAEQVERGKPAPDMFLMAAERMGVQPSECVVFEDGQSGIDAAEAAGMASVYVPTADERLKQLR